MRARQLHVWERDRRSDGNTEWQSTGYSSTVIGDTRSGSGRLRRSRRRGRPWALLGYGLVSVCGAVAVMGVLMQAVSKLTH